MKELVGRLVSVHAGNNEDLSKEGRASVEAKLDGFAGDKHSGFERVAWLGDKDPEGTVRRNERQWSGVSVEELAIIGKKMDLKEVLAVEEGNPPCSDMGEQITAKHTTQAGERAAGHLFPSRAFGLRGVVGVVDVPGVIQAGDKVIVQLVDAPAGN
ncbi:MAG: hypothetical protein JRD03_10660 [Deltaproteobacteria bacterium]|nr:hypothetical protein [Deltaproteobacteria bacterium]